MSKTTLDIWLDRGMKIIGVIGFLAAAFMAINGIMFLPDRVEAQEIEIQKIKTWASKTDERLAVLDAKLDYIAKGIDEVKRKIS